MFGNAWELGKISGIKIRIHWTFLLIPLYAYYSSLNAGAGAAAAMASVLFVLSIFGCVLLHELGHAFAARQFGISTRDIVLLPIGGVASLERMPRNPFQELWIAIAGPLVNVVIAIALFTGLHFSSVPAHSFASGFLSQLAVVNVVLVVFNLIPAFPMDGGRVFRSILAMFLDYVRATSIAATVGKVCAILIGVYGLFSGNFMLIFLATFVYFAGHSELMQVVYTTRQPTFHQNFTSGSHFQENGFEFRHPSAPANGNPEFEYGQKEISVPSTLSTSSVAAWLANMHAEYCSVVDSGRVIGRLTKAQLMAALSRGLGNLPIGQVFAHRNH